MNSTQFQERLRAEIKRRIDRGLLTGSALAAKAGLRPSHISNFLHRRRNLSHEALDSVLAALSLNIFSFAPKDADGKPAAPPIISNGAFVSVPLVSHDAAIHSPVITRSVILQLVQLSAGSLDKFPARRTTARRSWQRFVAVRLTASDALPMLPVLHAESIVILDRHYNSLKPVSPPQPNLYGVDFSGSLVFRYAARGSGQMILRPHTIDHPVELLEISEGASPSDFIVGRVCISISQH